MAKIKNSFSTRLSINVIIITMVLFIVAMFVVWRHSRDIITDEAKRNATNMLDASIGDIEKILSNVEAATLNSVWVVKEHKDSPDYMYRITEALVKGNPNIIGSTVAFIPYYYQDKGECFSPYTYLDNDSVTHSIQLGTATYDYHNKEWFKKPMEELTPTWCEPYYDDGGGQEMMTTFSVPIKDDNGVPFAVITADVSLKNLTEIINSTKPYDNSYAALVSKVGTFVAHVDTSYILKKTLGIVRGEHAVADTTIYNGIMEGRAGIGEMFSHGDRCFCVYGPVSNGWSAYLMCPYDAVLKNVSMMRLIVQIIIIVGLILIFICCLHAVRRLTQPINQFSQYALEIARGNFDYPLPLVKSKDEIKDLHDSLYVMQQSLKQLKATTAAKERYESELNIARNIQLGLLPGNFPPYFHAKLVPAREVGGDLYDFIATPTSLYFVIGDVSGKGVPAALLMALTKSALRFVAGLGVSMGEMMARVNNAINESNEMDMFVTLFVGRLDLQTGVLQYCNAGHNPVVIVSPDGTPDFLHAKINLVAGLMPDFDYVGEEIILQPGSRLILYTDGVTEAETETKAQYGEQRLLEFAAKSNNASAKETTEQLLASVNEFTAGAEQNDDITIITIDYGETI